MGLVRLMLDANYDSLVRSLLGINSFGEKLRCYPLQTLKDNVGLLDEETIEAINELVVKEVIIC